MGFIPFTEQQREQARRTDLAAFLRQCGEKVRKSGTENMWLDHGQKVTIRGNLWFHQYEQVGGDAIDFACRFYGMDYPEAVQLMLSMGVGTVREEVEPFPQKPLELPPKHDNMRRVYGYLIRRRGIAKDVLDAFAYRELVYESSDYHNAVFVGVDKTGKKYKPETIKKDITVLSFIMQNAVDNGLCKINPVAKSVRLPKIERAEKTAYTQEQYNTVYEFAKNHPNGLAIMVLMETGISRSELLGLTWDDFDRENGVMHINQGLVSYKDVDEGWVTEADGLKNEYQHRSIPVVEPELLKRLREKPKTITLTPNRYHPEITQQVETTFIFHSPEGKPYQPHNWNNRVFVPFMRELQKAHPEIPTLSAHELRHTRASLWIAGGMEPYMAARLLGHTDLKMLLKIYDHTNVETLRKALVGVRSEEEEKRA